MEAPAAANNEWELDTENNVDADPIDGFGGSANNEWELDTENDVDADPIDGFGRFDNEDLGGFSGFSAEPRGIEVVAERHDSVC